MFDFGLRLKELRKKYSMSQSSLGKRIGRSKSVISNYENNIKIPPTDVIADIASVFNVSTDYLLGFDKAEMISVDGLSENQKQLVQAVVFELRDKTKTQKGLSERQQSILSALMREFFEKQR